MRQIEELDELDLIDAQRLEHRTQEIARSAEFGAVYQDNAGETRSFAALAPAALEAHQQLELDLTGYSSRRAVRMRFADVIEPFKHERDYLASWPARLRNARHSAQSGIRVKDGKIVTIWDNKAGLSRVCPDDAREESMRMQRKTVPRFVDLQASGHSLHYMVLTTPNARRGKLRDENAAIFDRFKQSLKAKDKHGDLLFPEIKGALCVLEAPLGRARDWNVHLNVILVIKGEWFDWQEFRQWWMWDVHFRKLPKGEDAIRGALCELIKYAVAATVTKSAEHADEAKSAAPPMLEWTRDELLEWFDAFHGFRRTRSYGVMYGIEQPEPEDIGPVVWIGTISLRGGRYVHEVPLLRSIPEDKFSGLSAAEKWQALIRALAPGGLAGAGELGESDAVRSSTRALRNL